MPAIQTTSRPFTGRHMAAIMVAFFLVVISVNVSMAVLANWSWTGLVVPNSYVASQHFNAETAKREAMLARGYRLGIAYDGKQLAFTARDRSDQPLHVASATLQLLRNESGVNHGILAFQCDAGRCVVDVKLAPGLWRGDMQVNLNGGDVWQQAVELLVKDQ